MSLEWSEDDDGYAVATCAHGEDTIEVKIVECDFGDRADLSCGSLEMSLDIPFGDPRKFAELLVAPFAELIDRVNLEVKHAQGWRPRPVVRVTVGFDANGSEVA